MEEEEEEEQPQTEEIESYHCGYLVPQPPFWSLASCPRSTCQACLALLLCHNLLDPRFKYEVSRP